MTGFSLVRILIGGAVALALAACGGGSPSQPTPTPTPAPCTFTVTGAPAGAVAAATSEITLSIATQASCAWAASTTSAFITAVGPMSGTGNGSVRFAIQANTSDARQGSVQVAGQTITVQQSAGAPQTCDLSVTPTDTAVAAQGGGVSIDVVVTSGTNCAWTAVTNDAFLSIKSGASGTGNGAVVLTATNNSGNARTGTATVAGRTVMVAQPAAGQVACAFTVSPPSVNAPATASSPVITVTNTAGSNCGWTAQSNASFISVQGGGSGVGSGSVTLNIAANSGAQRQGTVTIAGAQVSVSQTAGAPSAGPVAYLAIQSDPGDYIGQGASATYTLQSGQFTVTIDAARGLLDFRMVPGGQWTLSMAAPPGQALTAGSYNRAGRFSSAAGQPGMDFSGMGRGCNKLTGRFAVSQAVYSGVNTVDRFHAVFEQHCENSSVKLRGELWIDSQGAAAPPISPMPVPGSPTTFFSYVSDTGDPVGGGQSRSFTMPTAKFTAWPTDTRTVSIHVEPPTGGGFHWNLNFQAPSGQLAPGTYTTAFPTPAGTARLFVNGNGVSCTSTGQFTVLEVDIGPDGAVYRFHATFAQHCSSGVPALRGEIRIVADPWR